MGWGSPVGGGRAARGRNLEPPRHHERPGVGKRTAKHAKSAKYFETEGRIIQYYKFVFVRRVIEALRLGGLGGCSGHFRGNVALNEEEIKSTEDDAAPFDRQDARAGRPGAGNGTAKDARSATNYGTEG